MAYQGDYRTTDTVYLTFTTVTTTGAPTTLAGTPKVRCYKSGSLTESSDITPTVDLDSRTGLNLVTIDLTGDSGFYAAAKDYSVIITAGTVGGTSVVGYNVGDFSVENRSAVMPTTAARKLDVSAGGEAGVDWANVGTPGSTVSLSATTVSALTTNNDKTGYRLSATGVDDVLDDPLSDSVPADGALPTLRQAVYMITQFLTERSVSSTTLTVKKVDGSTALMTFTLNDATTPTSITRTT